MPSANRDPVAEPVSTLHWSRFSIFFLGKTYPRVPFEDIPRTFSSVILQFWVCRWSATLRRALLCVALPEVENPFNGKIFYRLHSPIIKCTRFTVVNI